MPFYPIKKDDERRQAEAPKMCTHPEHEPPSMMVFREAGVWVCPACHAMTMINPTQYHH